MWNFGIGVLHNMESVKKKFKSLHPATQNGSTWKNLFKENKHPAEYQGPMYDLSIKIIGSPPKSRETIRFSFKQLVHAD